MDVHSNLNALPLYTAAASLPAYTPDAESHERVVETAGPSSARTPSQEYDYKNGSLYLNLGPKRDGLFRPAYGWNGCVEGFVRIKKKTTSVLSITVSVEGHVTTGVSERGFLTDMTKTRVLHLSQTLFDGASGQPHPTSGASYEFSLPLPSYVTGGTLPLPPTFTALHPGVGADVTYFVKVEMVRKGILRQNERLKAFFFYLPRTYASTPHSAHGSEKPEDSSGWHISSVLPKLPCGAAVTSASNLCVAVALPQPLEYAAGSAIPFYLTVASGTASEALPRLFSGLSVQLLRVTSLKVGERQSSSAVALGGGEVFRVEERGDVRTIIGSIQSKQGESSWAVSGVEVKYIVRVRLEPRPDAPSLTHALPTYRHEQVVKLRTHEHALGNNDERQPALCCAPRSRAM